MPIQHKMATTTPMTIWRILVDDEVFLSQMASEGDEDAQAVQEFEAAIIDTVQESEGLCEVFLAYKEARERLKQKATSRGFWPIGQGGKAKGKGGKQEKKGQKNPGKFTGGYSAARQSLAERIANSKCAKCKRYGHWKRECPNQESAAVAVEQEANTAVDDSNY